MVEIVKNSKAVLAAAKTTSPLAEKLNKLTPLQYSASLAEISDAIWKIEGIRVVFCANQQRRIPGLGYDYLNKLKTGTVGDLMSRLDTVLKPAGDTIEWIIIDGDGRAKFTLAWKLEKIRASYVKQVSV